MLWIPSKRTKRFTLYHLEENEIYIRDFSGSCSYVDPISNEEHQRDKGKFYICSKSIVYESERQTTPLLKFKFDSMRQEPTVVSEEDEDGKFTRAITFTVSKIIAIKCSSNTPPQPFRHIEELNSKIMVYPSYETPEKLMDWLSLLSAYGRKKTTYDLDEHIFELIKEKENKRGFNMSLIDSVTEKPLLEDNNIFVRRILPLNHVHGYMFATDASVYFEPFHSISGKAVHRIVISDIAKLFKRRFELREIGLEIITRQQKSYYFTFENPHQRKCMYEALVSRVSKDCLKLESLEQMTYRWQNKELSNYEYLMHLNEVGNRSLSDLSQYPVFPWVIADYTSDQLQLQDFRTYRDLSKPIGALNEDRLRAFLERYHDMPEPRFMYGSHYSAPGYVIGYLVRKRPEYMLKLQSGRFDKPDRLFKSIKGDWNNVMQNPTSLKELIPEFYQNDPSFLVNHLNLDLGVRQNKKKVGDVKLPHWAKGDPNLFLELMRKALESDYVSEHLHLWIDLIFGAKQRGPQAIKANNGTTVYNLVFNYMTYEGMVNVEQITDPIEKMGVKCQINEFGQCPKQVFKIAHPARGALTVLNSVPPLIPLEQPTEQKEDTKEVELQQKVPTIKNVQASSLYSAAGKPKVKTLLSMGKPTDVKLTEIPKAHKMALTRILSLTAKPNSVVTIGQDGFLKVFDLNERICLKSFKICEFCLSSIVPIKSDQIFAIGSWDNSIYLFNIVYGSKSKPISAHDNSVSDLVFLPKRKRLVSSSWDCSIKFWRVVGSNIEHEDVFQDHDNQINCLGADSNEQLIAYGDIEGNIICVSIDEREKLYELNLNGQKICRTVFINSNLIAVAEIDIRLIDQKGNFMTTFKMEDKNGSLTDVCLDSEHLYAVTTRKHLGLYDILQEKKLGSYFNDYRTIPEDRLPNEKELTCVVVAQESTMVLVGSSAGNLYVLRS